MTRIQAIFQDSENRLLSTPFLFFSGNYYLLKATALHYIQLFADKTENQLQT